MRNIVIIFGGPSTEHVVSLESASNIFNAIDREKYCPLLLGVNIEGDFFYNSNYPRTGVDLVKNDFFKSASECYLLRKGGTVRMLNVDNNQELIFFDVAFSIIHGRLGEDGVLQGLLTSLNIPFIGSGVLASSICMDKDVTKIILRDAGIPVTNSITVRKADRDKVTFEEVKRKLELPLFIKPCNSGSSVGVNKVKDRKSFETAIQEAFLYDNKILIEEAIVGREIECAILGNENPNAAALGEIIPINEFYSYHAKYQDKNGAVLKIPASIPENVSQKIKETAIEVFELLECEGMARVDFFLQDNGSFVVNEINTIPGFTNISMYPKLWEYSGICLSDLINKLISLACERFEREEIGKSKFYQPKTR